VKIGVEFPKKSRKEKYRKKIKNLSQKEKHNNVNKRNEKLKIRLFQRVRRLNEEESGGGGEISNNAGVKEMEKAAL
jgi:hypothetical protein